MKTTIKISDTRYPALTRAVLKQLGGGEDARAQLYLTAIHGADPGWSGFTYYSETVAFFTKHRTDILAMLSELYDDLGENMIDGIKRWKCLEGLNPSNAEIMDTFSGRGKSDVADQIANALAWFALEEIARELCPDA